MREASVERESAGKRAGWRVCPRAAIDEHWVQWLPAMHAAFIGATAERARASRTADGPAASAHTCVPHSLFPARQPPAQRLALIPA